MPGPADACRPKILGGYAVIPTGDTLRRIVRADVQAATVIATLAEIRRLEAEILEVRADVALRLRDECGAKWATIGRRLHINMQNAFRLGSARRDQLARRDTPEPCPADQAA